MFKRMATDPNTQPTTMQQIQMCAIKNARLLPDGCRFLNNTGNEILFRINISQPLTIAGLEGVDLQLGLPGHWTSHQWTSPYEATLKPWCTLTSWSWKVSYCPYFWGSSNHQAATWHFLSTHVSLWHVVSRVTRSVAIRLNICSKLAQNTTFFSE